MKEEVLIEQIRKNMDPRIKEGIEKYKKNNKINKITEGVVGCKGFWQNDRNFVVTEVITKNNCYCKRYLYNSNTDTVLLRIDGTLYCSQHQWELFIVNNVPSNLKQDGYKPRDEERFFIKDVAFHSEKIKGETGTYNRWSGYVQKFSGNTYVKIANRYYWVEAIPSRVKNGITMSRSRVDVNYLGCL